MNQKDNRSLYTVAITVIIYRGDKFLLIRRAKTKKRFPGVWTVPGGNLDKSDFLNTPKDTDNAWYNILEKVAKREVKEETGLDISNVTYLVSLVADYQDSYSLVISTMAKNLNGEIKLQLEESDEYVWVTPEEAKQYDLIDGIYDELCLAKDKLTMLN